MENGEILTKRKGQYFVDNGRLFHFQKLIAKGAVEAYICAKRDSKNCPVRIHVEDGVIIKQYHTHTCSSNPAEIEVKRIQNRLKEYAVQSQENPDTLLGRSISGQSQAVLLSMPNKDATRKMIQRARNAISGAPSNPSSLQDIVFPASYQMYKGEQFLLVDSGAIEPDNERIVIFGKQSYQDWSQQVGRLFIDGTFSVCPPLFYQLVEILAERGGRVFPIFFALLPNKSRRTYDRLFGYIKEIRPNLMPMSIATDYEIALYSAAQNAWPDVEIRGCFFHLHQAIKRKICSKGLKRRYDNDPDFNLWSKCIASLAYVPTEKITESFEKLVQEMPDEIRGDLEPILDYFEDTYIGRPIGNNKRRKPRFCPSIWSVYSRVINDQDRTNNYSEAAHKRLHKQFAMDHPTIWKFIDALKFVQEIQDKVYEEFVRGDQPAQKRKKYRSADDKIKEIVEGGLERRTVTEYLKGISTHYSIS
ncbi:hypothetical protein M3Y97_01165800 [Aphelenchoides bicaudatus]|nr:hypothetical protein M3Y97_01165800 [Aphelenchoides bicaudatus]